MIMKNRIIAAMSALGLALAGLVLTAPAASANSAWGEIKNVDPTYKITGIDYNTGGAIASSYTLSPGQKSPQYADIDVVRPYSSGRIVCWSRPLVTDPCGSSLTVEQGLVRDIYTKPRP